MSSSSIRRRRILAFLLDLLVSVLAADLMGLAATALLWNAIPAARAAVPWVWYAAGAGAVSAFLLRDQHGGLARKWLALQTIDREGREPGRSGSIRRNLPLIIPVWNLFEVWPVLRNGSAERPADRRRGFRVVETA